jgi:hypothetical protein
VFRELINDAKSAAGAVIAKYTVRASVVVPFVCAIGFATAALTIVLVDRFGAVAAYMVVAAGFAAIGLIGLFSVNATERERDLVEAEAASISEGHRGVASVPPHEPLSQVPLALLGTLLAAAGGPSSTVGIARVLGRNAPLVALAVVIGVLLLPDTKPEEPDNDDDIAVAKMNGAAPPANAPIQPPA